MTALFIIFLMCWTWTILGFFYFLQFDSELPNKNKYRLLIICCGFFVWIIKIIEFIYMTLKPIDKWFREDKGEWEI